MPRAISRAAVRMKSFTTADPMTCSTIPSSFFGARGVVFLGADFFASARSSQRGLRPSGGGEPSEAVELLVTLAQ